MSFPNKADRQKCWTARDNYWACLEQHAPTFNSTSGTEEPQQCKALRKLFESGCPNQWVKHFDRKRTYEQFKEKMQKGFDPVTTAK